ncbi:hypothetical protein HMPREF3091_12375 [Hafnia sp. HMSC23F03]|nr:hypothetical protein HMPREF3091_12375 [Hafnia sp. HMSC23F03]
MFNSANGNSLFLRTFKNNELNRKQNLCGISAGRRIKNFDKKVTKVEFYSTKNRGLIAPLELIGSIARRQMSESR